MNGPTKINRKPILVYHEYSTESFQTNIHLQGNLSHDNNNITINIAQIDWIFMKALNH